MNKKEKFIFMFFCFIIIIMIICGPLIVKNLIMTNYFKSEYSKIWDSKDAITYYASIICSIVSVIGIFITVLFSNRNYRIDLKNQVKPCLVLSKLDIYRKYPDGWIFNFFPNEEKKEEHNEDFIYKESHNKNVYFILEGDKITYKRTLDKKQIDLVKKDGNIFEEDKNGAFILKNKMFFNIPLELENVGKGAAINVRIGLNKSTTKKEKKYLEPINLKVGDIYSIHLFSEDINNLECLKYNLDISYKDIYDNEIYQSFPVNIKKIDDYKFSINIGYAINQKNTNKS